MSWVWLSRSIFSDVHCKKLELWTCSAYRNFTLIGGGGGGANDKCFIFVVKMVHSQCLFLAIGLLSDILPDVSCITRIRNIIISSTVILAADWSIAVGYWIVFHCFSLNGNVRIRISVLSPLSKFYLTSPWQLWVWPQVYRSQPRFEPLATKNKMADIPLHFAAWRILLAFKTLFAHVSLPTWCIHENKDGRK